MGGLTDMLILLMWFRGGEGSRGKMLILLNVKDQNSYSPNLTLWLKALYEKISPIHP